jgi:hypothetical protein
MGNYIETARSNYFKVKDLKRFKKAIAPFGGIEIIEGENGTIAVLGRDETFPDMGWDENGNEMKKTFSDVVAAHLTDDSVFVAVGAGYEKMRYVIGWAYAVDNTNTRVYINTDDIYEKAKKKFAGKTITQAQY